MFWERFLSSKPPFYGDNISVIEKQVDGAFIILNAAANGDQTAVNIIRLG